MKKIPTLFVRNPDDRKHVLDEVTPGCEWVLAGEGVATRKYDGTCVKLDENGQWWSRREVKAGKDAPNGWEQVAHDPATGKAVGWEPIEQSGFAKFHAEALASADPGTPGTYELIGPKINGNPEGWPTHFLMCHHCAETFDDAPRDFDDLRSWLLAHDYEGIVWRHDDGRMVKLKRRDFE